MRTTQRTLIALAATGLLGLSVAGCDDYLTVDNPNIVDASTIDPLAEASSLALSVEQEFADNYAELAAYSAWFTGSLYNSDINPGGNLLASRNLEETSGPVEGLYTGLSRTRALAGLVFETVEGTPVEVSESAARATLFSGFAFLFFADFYCQATVDGGPAMGTATLLDSATVHLGNARTLAQQVGHSDFENAAKVGLARAYLQMGDAPQAIQAAESVDPAFTYNMRYSDDLANRDRVGNYLYYSQASQTTISVAPAYRSLGDPRVVTHGPENHNFVAMDGETPIWSMEKYNSYSAPIRLASSLEAEYILAEANGTAAMLALAQERRAAAGLEPYSGATDPPSVLEEFLEQKTRDFFVEGKRMGDYRRHPDGLRTLIPAGTEYHKTGLPAYGDQQCWPIPEEELSNNPNLER